MKINKKVEEALNEQINKELFSSYLYLSIAANFRGKNLHGFAHWMEVQSNEELEHAMKIYHYIYERGGEVTLEKLDKPKTKWDTCEEALNEAYEHEKFVTKSIEDLVKLSREENDYATENMLQWFIKEQVEEEASTEELLIKLRMVGEKGNGLYMLDKELSNRKE
ncbi:MAG: ferritin [Candidatus ainarchaeum sp.]|nr:ferritin [Candidatus ainarchaeum sp.]